MDLPLRVLHIEDRPSDAKLVARELARLGRPIAHHCIDDPATLRAALQTGEWDVVLSDWSMPRLSGLAALEIVKESGLDVPFLIVSGTVDEETAVCAMRAGARDYVLKDKLLRLAPAIERELREQAHRQARRRAEEQQRESDRRYQLIVETTTQGVVLLDDQATFTYVNAQMAAMLGYEPAEIIGRCMIDFVDPESCAVAKVATAESQPAITSRADLRLMRRDGSRIWVHCESTPIFDDARVCRGRLTMVTDITERRRTDEALRISQARLARLTESGIIGITVNTAAGEVLEANDTFLSMLGYTRADLDAGAIRWTDLTPADWSTTNAAFFEDIQRFGRASPREKEYLRKDGTRVPVMVGVAALDDPHLLAVSVDLTEHKRTEKALRVSESRFARLAESGLIGIALSDLQGNVYEVNDACRDILGFEREDLAREKLNWAARTPPEWKDVDRRAMEQLKLTGATPPWEKELIAKDGHRVPVLAGMAMLDPPNCISFFADLSDRKRAESALRQTEEQLRQVQKMEAVGRLAGGIAHDFNNILTVILSYGHFLLEELKAGSPLRDDVQEICKAGKRAADLTRQLLLFSRQQVFEPRIIDPSETLAEMDKMLRRVLGEDVELIVTTEGSVGRVRVDPTSLEQVVMNLVVNARDAMPTGGKLTIEMGDIDLGGEFACSHVGVAPGPYLRLAVTDTGCGMDRGTLARVFEPFFTTKEKGKGTGLGLSTVFGIVQQCGGTVWVESEPGTGTTFTIYLPRSEEPGIREVLPAPSPKPWRGCETVLLVEDEEQVRVVARGILARHGYRVLDAGTAAEALLVSEKHAGTIDLLISDVVMPQMSGPELAKRLTHTRTQMRVLCMSGYTDDSVVRHGLVEGVFAFIQKPLTPETLARKVREVLDRPAAYAALVA